MKFDKKRFLPFLLTAIILIADQYTKFLITVFYEIGEKTDVFKNDLLYICHVRNKAIAFSLGQGISDSVKPVLFIVLPLLVLAFLTWYYIRSDDFTALQRWAAAGIIGGGLGNITDRIFRPEGVVDFISVKFFGLLGFERWPTFNLADSSVVVCCILLFISILFAPKLPVEKPAQ